MGILPHEAARTGERMAETAWSDTIAEIAGARLHMSRAGSGPADAATGNTAAISRTIGNRMFNNLRKRSA